jgi:glycine/D-amino acid oxidase-like deaminating enzyme
MVGTATAFYASKAGLRAVVLERRPRLASLTTAAATGAFRMQLTDPAELPIIRHSIDLFASFEDQTRQSVLASTRCPQTTDRCWARLPWRVSGSTRDIAPMASWLVPAAVRRSLTSSSERLPFHPSFRLAAPLGRVIPLPLVRV